MRFAILKTALSTLLGAAVGCVLVAVALHLLTGFAAGLSETLREDISLVTFTITFIGLLAAIDAMIAVWRHR